MISQRGDRGKAEPDRQGIADLIPLEEVPRRLPTRTHRSSVFRWAQKGRRGVRLRTVTVGSTRCTTETWLMAFFAAVEETRTETPQETAPGPAKRRRRGPVPSGALSPETEAVLRRHGLEGPRGGRGLIDPTPTEPGH